MKLNLLERLMIQSILPKEADFVTLKIMNNLRQSVAPSEEEYKEFEIRQDEGRVIWNSKGNEEKEIEVGEKATDVIKGALEKLDKEKKLTQDLFTLFEKFV